MTALTPDGVKELILRSFTAMEYPGDWCLIDSREGDEPVRVAREFRGRTDWRTLSPEFIDQAPEGLASALSFSRMSRITVTFLLLALMSSSCGRGTHPPGRDGVAGPPALTDEPFDVRVSNYNGVAAYGIEYRMQPGLLRVTWFGDLEGEKDREIFRKDLSPVETRAVRRSIHLLPLTELKSQYVDPRIADGLQLRFDIRVGESERRTITVANVHQEDLARFTESLDELLPPRFRIGYRSNASLPAEPGPVPLTEPRSRLAPVAAFLDLYISRRIRRLFDRSSRMDEYDVAAEITSLLAAFEESLGRAGLGVVGQQMVSRRLVELAVEIYAREFVGDPFVPERYRAARDRFERILDEARAQLESPEEN